MKQESRDSIIGVSTTIDTPITVQSSCNNTQPKRLVHDKKTNSIILLLSTIERNTMNLNNTRIYTKTVKQHPQSVSIKYLIQTQDDGYLLNDMKKFFTKRQLRIESLLSRAQNINNNSHY